jgi:hypothetical protein
VDGDEDIKGESGGAVEFNGRGEEDEDDIVVDGIVDCCELNAPNVKGVLVEYKLLSMGCDGVLDGNTDDDDDDN